jgi:hypothetical protein
MKEEEKEWKGVDLSCGFKLGRRYELGLVPLFIPTTWSRPAVEMSR